MPLALDEYTICAREEDKAALKSLVESITKDRSPVCLEVGSWVGATALAMVEAGAGRVYCVDTWLGSEDDPTGRDAKEFGQEAVLRAFCGHVNQHLLKTIFPVVGTSAFWASVWRRSVDLVFIDAAHDYESVKQDIALWTPHVKIGGIISGHDCSDYHAGVKRAVEESGSFEIAGGSVWWRRKNAPAN